MVCQLSSQNTSMGHSFKCLLMTQGHENAGGSFYQSCLLIGKQFSVPKYTDILNCFCPYCYMIFCRATGIKSMYIYICNV